MNLAKILAADTGGDALRSIYHKSSYALAALVPLAAMSKEGDGALRAIDLGLAVALPVHSHIALNYVVSDYIPKSIRGPARYGVLVSTAVATLGLARLAMSEPGVTGTVKRLWSPAEADRRAAAMAKEARKELAVAAKKK